jgi:hypothetical protein
VVVSGWASAVAALRRELRAGLEQIPHRLFGWTLTAKSSEVGDKDELETGDGDGSQRPVRRVEPFGFRSRAPQRVRAFQVRLGSQTVFLGVASTTGYGKTDLEGGEVAVYTDQVPNVLFGAHDGHTEVNAKSGQTVNVNGDTYAMPQWDTFATDLFTFLTSVGVAVNAAQIAAAATTFKTSMTAASNYKSTRAKNG